jgi:DnaD/phage-associated family protein
LKRLLKPADIQLVMYLYESLNFPPDLILYLYEYCISMNKAHRSYLEAVALNWHRDGIRTVEQAAITTAQYKKNYYTIAKALGFQRALADAECSFIEKWLHTWGFPLEVVLEACNRTVLQIQNPNFPYTDRILEAWHKAGAHTLPEIKKQDEAFSRSTAAKKKQTEQKPQKAQKAPNTQKKNSFSSFEQYNYSSDDLSQMEKALLNKSAKRASSKDSGT